MTTTSSLEGWDVSEYLGPVSAQFVIGTGIFADFFSGWTDFFGAHSRSYQNKLDKIDREALDLLTEKALRLGGNAVLGLRVDHDEISGGGKSMLMVSASGTVVRARQVNPAERPTAKASVGAVTSHDLAFMLRRREITALATEDRLNWLSEDTWRFIVDNQIDEVALLFVSKFEKILKDSATTPEHVALFRQKFEELFSALPPSISKPILYGCCERDKRLYNYALVVMRNMDALEPSQVVKLLRGNDEILAQRAVALATLDMPFYEAGDIASLQAIRHAISSRFSLAEKREEKGLLGRKIIWTCQCGRKVDAPAFSCGSCSRNRWGFPSDLIHPGDALAQIDRKIDALTTALTSPDLMQDGTASVGGAGAL